MNIIITSSILRFYFMYCLISLQAGAMFYLSLLVAFIIIIRDFKLDIIYFCYYDKCSSVCNYISVRFYIYIIILLYNPKYIKFLIIFIRLYYIISYKIIYQNLDLCVFFLESNLEDHFNFSSTRVNIGGNSGNGGISSSWWSGRALIINSGGSSNNPDLVTTWFDNSQESRPTRHDIDTSIFWFEDKPARLELANKLEDVHINKRRLYERLDLSDERVKLSGYEKGVLERQLTWNHPDSVANQQYLTRCSVDKITLNRDLIWVLRN